MAGRRAAYRRDAAGAAALYEPQAVLACPLTGR
jgi:hypothetical protein